MNYFLILLSVLFISSGFAANHHKAEVEDNEFAEFEEFEEDDELVIKEEETNKNPETKLPPPVQTFDDEVQIEVCHKFSTQKIANNLF